MKSLHSNIKKDKNNYTIKKEKALFGQEKYKIYKNGKLIDEGQGYDVDNYFKSIKRGEYKDRRY